MTLVCHFCVAWCHLMSLTRQQLEALSLLSHGFNLQETANKVGVSKRTLQRWVKLAEFIEAKKDVTQQTTARVIEVTAQDVTESIRHLVPKAVRLLEEILDCPEARNTDKLRASEILGRWSGLAQTQQQSQVSGEENLKGYLAYLASKNNGNGQTAN